MKKIVLLFILTITTSLTLISQNYSKGSITLKNDVQLNGNISIDYISKNVSLRKNNQTTFYSFDRVVSIAFNSRKLNKIEISEITYFAAPLEDGNASLYQINGSEYLITTKAGKYKVINLDKDKARIPGILALLFSDCNTIRASLNRVGLYKEHNLIKSVQTYNVCDYALYAPTPNEIEAAAAHNTDLANFYLGAGAGFSDITFGDNNDGETLVSAQFQLGVIASPNFFGTLQGSLFFALEGNAAFASEQTFSNVQNDINFKASTYRLLFGLEYRFNKNGLLQPFVGALAGPSGDYYEGTIDGNNFDVSGGSAILVPRAGLRYKLDNGDHIGLTVSYVTQYENNLSFSAQDEIIPLVINVETLTFGLNYYF